MHFRLQKNPVNSIFVLMFIAALLIYPALQRKIQVQLWHLWNGNKTQLQEHEIPVPMSWIANQTIPGTVALIEVGTHRSRDSFTPIIVVSKIGAPKDMNAISSWTEPSLRSQGAQVLDRKTIDFDGGKADCIVSNALIYRHHDPGDKIISIECASTAGLSMNFNGDKEHIDTVFSVLSQIRQDKGAGTQ